MTTAEDPLPTLIRGLRSEYATERVRAAKALGRLGWLAHEALPALTDALTDEEQKVRESAAHAIGQMGPQVVPTLVAMLEHEDKYIRRHAVWSLSKLGALARPALSELCQSLKDCDPRTASGAAQALGSIGADGADAVPALAQAMRGTNIVLCRLAAKALSQIGLPALPTLITHLQHTDPFVRGESALAIGWMGAAAQSAVPYLTGIIRGPESAMQETPAPESNTPISISLPKSQTITPQQLINTESQSAEVNCMVFAAQALGKIGPGAAKALIELRTAAANGPEAVREAAQQAIRQIEGV